MVGALVYLLCLRVYIHKVLLSLVLDCPLYTCVTISKLGLKVTFPWFILIFAASSVSGHVLQR
jgi:hypothetical protein